MTAIQPSKVQAHWTPMFSNSCVEKSGNPAAIDERSMMLAATVDAALLQYGQLLSCVPESTSENLQRQIRVDEIVEAWEIDAQNPESNEYACKGRCRPMNFRGKSSPTKPRGSEICQRRSLLRCGSGWLPTRKCQLRIPVPQEEQGPDATRAQARSCFPLASSRRSPVVKG